MKTLVLWMLVLTIASFSKAQYVDIPDTNFKNALIEAGIDTSSNGEISQDEAEAVTNLDVSNKDITDMTGIEAFINLDTLQCHFNQLTSLNVSNNIALKWLGLCCNKLTSLDVSNNTALTVLNCNSNELTSLNVSNNTDLISLVCYGNMLTSLDISNNIDLKGLSSRENQLTSLDVSKNTALTYLSCEDNLLTGLDVSNNINLICLLCYNNLITSIDVSNCKALDGFHCGNNLLTSLDISNNHNIGLIGYCPWSSGLGIGNMPSLHEVCVWNDFSPDSIYVDTTGSPSVSFTTDCAPTITVDYKENSVINIYPNPSDDIINIEIENINNTTIEIYNVSGRLVFSKKLNSKVEKIDISAFPKGIYIVKLMQEIGINMGKVVVR